jgi:DNA-binding transcriptional ArsR family regulator
MKLFTDDSLSAAETASAFAALGSEQRLAVLRCLVRAGAAGLRIGTLGERTGVTGSTLTHHLKILAQAGLISQTKTGRSIQCRVSYDRITALSAYLMQECCADRPLDESTRNG